MSSGFKLALFIIFSVLCFVVGYWDGTIPLNGDYHLELAGFVKLFSDQNVVAWIRFAGYWMILLAAIAWVVSLVRAYPVALCKDGWRWLRERRNLWAIVAVVVLWGMTQTLEEKSFKILLDEPVLVNTSRMMHYDRQVYVVSNAQRVDGIFAAKGYVDKRPNLFPFLLTCLHDLTGYRIENAYALNAALLLLLFALAFSVAAQIAGRWGGYLALGLLASVPLVWHQGAGAGFEILNLVMILFTLKVAIDTFNNPTAARLSALCLTTVMLAQVRYESVLFIFPVAILVLMSYGAAKKVMLPWGAWLAPLALVPVLWQQRVFRIDNGFWELFTVGVESPFSLDYYPENVRQAVFFFFTWMRQIPNAPLVAYIGGVAAVAFLVLMCLRLVGQVRRREIIDQERPILVLWIFGLAFLLYWTLLMCYAFDLGRYMVERLSLPLYLFMALAAAVVFGAWVRSRIFQKILLGAVAVGFVGWSLPSISAREYAAIYFPMTDAKFADAFIREHKDERFLMVADMSMLWTTYGIEALPNRAVNNQLRAVKYFLERPNNPPLYVMQSLEYSPIGCAYFDVASEPLTQKAILTPIKEYHVGTFRIMRISRLVDLDGVVAADDSELFQGDEASRLQDWVGNLP